MNSRRPEPGPDLQLERVGGGRRGSWKLGALATAAVLAGIVGFAVWGRTDRPPTVAEVPLTHEATKRATPPPSEPPATTQPTTRPTPIPRGEPPETRMSELRLGEDAYAVITTIDGRLYMDVLHEYEPGRLRGEFRIPFPGDAHAAYTIEFAQLWTRDRDVESFQVLRTWSVMLDSLEPGTSNATELVADVGAARPRARRAPRAIRQGFAIHLTAESRYTFGVLSVDATFGDPRPAATPGVGAANR